MSGRPITRIDPESCYSCRNSIAGKLHGTLNCKAKNIVVRGQDRDGCDSYKDSRKHSEVIPMKGW